jgi:ribosomal protein L11 methyltransferase
MDYTEVSFQNSSEQNELLIALLSDEEYESFEETEGGLKAYIPFQKFSEEKVREVVETLRESGNILFSCTLIKDRNWNALWESNFEPVLIGDMIYVHAPFHPAQPGIKYDILIEPKMSFGTGHHATTSLMMEEMLKMNMVNKIVLDMGCGSGILAILAAKMGAEDILAIDVEEWAFRNAFENCTRNQSQHVIVQKGDARLIQERSFEVILANINRNVLLDDFGTYYSALKNNGHLLISGFITDDVNKMLDAGAKYNLRLLNHASKKQWALIHFEKAA